MSHGTGPDVSQYATIYFDGLPYSCIPNAAYQSLATWDRKTVSGDYTRDSDPFISSRIWSDFTGGLGVENFREGSDEGRYAFGTILVDSPFLAALNNKVTTVSSVKYPLGDFADVFYAASATQVFPWNESTDTFGAALAGTLSFVPVHRGISWNGRQYIPLGASGYQRHNGVTVEAVVGTVLAKGFVEWDNRLFAFCTDGTLKSTQDGTTWVTEATVNSGHTPRRVAVYMNAQGDDTIFLVTDRAVFAWDPLNALLIPTRLKFPPHPDNGLGATVWRSGEDFHIFCGLQRYQYNISSVVANGPDRRDGLPASLRGKVVDADSAHNEVLALVEGAAASPVSPAAEFDSGTIAEDDMSLSLTEATSALLAWTGIGWHCRWISSGAVTPTWLSVSGAASAYRVWWGDATNGQIYTVQLSRTFANPSVLVSTGEGLFEASGYLDTGWYDAGMRNFEKLASHVEINLEAASSTETVTVEYKTDWNTSWVTLGTAAAQGQTILPFNVLPVDGSYQFSYGTSFHRIRFRISLSRGSTATLTPLLDSMSFEFVKVPKSGETTSLTLDLNVKDDIYGRTSARIKDELDGLLTGNAFVRFQSGSISQRVRLAGILGENVAGQDENGIRTIRIIRVPLDGYEGGT